MSTFPASANNAWRPSCDWQAVRRRAAMLARIRRFFARRGVLEVETPLLGIAVSTDPHLDFFSVEGGGCALYLQTSPELAMKRLLAAGSGPIYQICKAFRRGESGRWHNPEFTLLEWYRPGFSLDQLMDEVAALLMELLAGRVRGQQRFAYGELFREHIGVSWDAPLTQLEGRATALGIPEAAELCGQDRRLWLDLLFSLQVQPHLPPETLVFVHDYPHPLAALARLKPEKPEVAERFEVFALGIELGNGYRELTDPVEQRHRFEEDLAWRRRQSLPVPPLDEAFLAALEAGLPECSGVALGLDRILVLMLERDSLAQVLAFPLRAIA